MLRRAVVLFFVLSLALFTCKKKVPKAGDACSKEGSSMCVGETRRFTCLAGHYLEESCGVCSESKSFGSSTMTSMNCTAAGVGPEGAPCYSDGSTDCDGKELVDCISGHYRHFKCGGSAEGCNRKLNTVFCDASIAAPGEACTREGNNACSPDRKIFSVCHDGKLVIDRVCTGAKGCTITKPTPTTSDISCDGSIATIGDPCSRGGACSTDRTSLLRCKDGKLAVSMICRGANPTCTVDEKDAVGCATPDVSQVGDPCADGGTCSVDGKALLKCENGKFVESMKCKACTTTGDKVTCKH